MEPTPSSRPAANQATLLLAGSTLIVLAIVVLVSSSWQTFSPWTRIALGIIPLVALYFIGFKTRAKEEQAAFSLYTLLTASLIFPFVIGLAVYQSGLYPYMDATLVFIVSLISLIWYVLLAFPAGLTRLTPLLPVAATTLTGSFLDIISSPSYGYSIAGILLGYFFLSLASNYEKEQEDWAIRIYTWTGVVFGWLGLASLPQTVSAIWDKPTTGYYGDFVAPNYSNYTVGYLAVSVVFFFIAVAYSKAWAASKNDTHYEIRRIAENSAAAALTLPALIGLLSASSATNGLLAVLCGAVSLALSVFIAVPTFRWAGYLTGGAGLAWLLFAAAQDVAAFWPILLLVIGFLFIGLAYGLHHTSYRSILQRLNLQPANSLFGLGAEPEEPKHLNNEGEQTPNVQFLNRYTSRQSNDSAIWIFLLLVILIAILVQ